MNRREFLLTSSASLGFRTLMTVAAVNVLGCGIRPNVSDSASTIGGSTRLFLDDHNIAEMAGLSRLFHAPDKSPTPVLAADKPWEVYDPAVGLGIVNLYGSVFYDPDLSEFVMYYQIYPNLGANAAVCFATSADLVNWNKPLLNTLNNPQSAIPTAGTNIVIANSGEPSARQALSPTVIKWDGNYACMYYDSSAQGGYSSPSYFAGGCVSFSPDGVTWTPATSNPVLLSADVIDVFYDEAQHRFLAYFKMWQLQAFSANGSSIETDYEYVRSFDTPIQLDATTYQITGDWFDLKGQRSTIDTVTVRNCSQLVTRRVVFMASSADFLHWSNYQAILIPDALDVAGTEFYGMSVFKVGSLYIGLLRVMTHDGAIYLELVFGEDGVNWTRSRFTFIAPGPASWDSGMIFSANAPVVKDGQVHFFYGGYNETHENVSTFSAKIGDAVLRKNGYCSLSSGSGAGSFTTIPLQVNSEDLFLNVSAPLGLVKVGLLHSDGSPVQGFTQQECDEISGIDNTEYRVTWNGRSIAAFVGTSIAIAFTIENGELYSLRA